MKDAHRLRKLLTNAVADALSIYGPVGVVCSGGIDSSTIACLAARHGSFNVYTGYYDTPGFDERRYARLVPGVHQEVLIKPKDFVDYFDEMVPSLRPPFQGMGTFGQYMVAKRMGKQGVEVALSGEGADELFGGYARLMRVAGATLPDNYSGVTSPEGYPDNLVDALEWEMNHLPDLLAVDDQVLAANGIEGRAPFTDPAVMEFALSLPATSRVNKVVLREAMQGIVPNLILGRTDKMGFPIPLALWAQKDPVKTFVKSRIGRLPDPSTPWDRDWWYEMLEATSDHREPQPA